MLIPHTFPTFIVKLAALIPLCTLLGLTATPAQTMPRRDVVEIPAMDVGLWVSNTFQSNMVLQRDKPIHLWGWADPGETVTVSFAGKFANATAAEDRAWKVTLDAMPANREPQTLTIKGKTKTVTLENILVGDVWILSGQSNMEFELAKVENGQLEIVSAHYSQLRILTVPQGTGPDPVKGFARVHQWSDWSKRHFRKGDWDVCTPEIAKDLSAIGYVFARRLHMASGVPIGVIDTSRGGTTLESWTPLATLREINDPTVKAMLAEWDAKVAAFDPQKDLEQRIAGHGPWLKIMERRRQPVPDDRLLPPTETLPGPIADPNHPGSCFAGMLAPIKGLSVKGVIWHQGYNNANFGLNGAEMYAAVFPQMIKAWREAFGDPALPFGIMSLCTDGDPQTLADYCEKSLDPGIDVRTVQYKTFLDLYNAGDKNIGYASTFDLRRAWYHPQLKIPAGERIARWALATQYGFDRELQWKPPVVTKMEVAEGKLTLTFDAPVAEPTRDAITGFSIAGQDRRFHPATAVRFPTGKDNRGRMQYDSKRLVLSSIMVPEPIHFRYASGRNPLANLQVEANKDLPFPAQRSDDWPLHTVPSGILPDDLKPPYQAADLQKLRLALQEMDKQRRLAEARKLIEQLEPK
jgi:sialate O-acetylesterase